MPPVSGWSPAATQRSASGPAPATCRCLAVRVGAPLAGVYLDFLAGRCRSNTVLAAGIRLRRWPPAAGPWGHRPDVPRSLGGRPGPGDVRSRPVPCMDRHPARADCQDWLRALARHTPHERPTHQLLGNNLVFLGPGSGHFRRSNYSTRIARPAADGWYPERKGPYPRAAASVPADLSEAWPGDVKSPWPSAVPGELYDPPTGRGVPRLAGKEGWGRCSTCGHTIRLRVDGLIGSHKIAGACCAGTEAVRTCMAPTSTAAVLDQLLALNGSLAFKVRSQNRARRQGNSPS
jgi:hypothetical protein